MREPNMRRGWRLIVTAQNDPCFSRLWAECVVEGVDGQQKSHSNVEQPICIHLGRDWMPWVYAMSLYKLAYKDADKK